MGRSARWKLRLSQVETFVFFAAMLLAITLEGACVYWLGAARRNPSTWGHPFPESGGRVDSSDAAAVLVAGSVARAPVPCSGHAATAPELGPG